MVVSLTGPSGTGKTSVARRLLTTPGNHLRRNGFLIPSFTTRTRRDTDMTGEYEYVNMKTFHTMYNDGQFVWTAEYGGGRYGTRAADLQHVCDNPSYQWISILVPERMQVLADFLAERHDTLFSFFFLPPTEEVMRHRLVERGELIATEIDRRVEDSRHWEADARCSGIPYLFVPDMPDLAQKYLFVEETLRVRSYET